MEDVSSRLEVFVGRTFTIYVGARDDLIKEGLATEDMFPSGREVNAHNLGLGVPREKWWRMTRRKGGVYELRRWHSRDDQKMQPPPWNPGEFKARIQEDFQAMFNVLISTAKGDFEKSTYETRVHKFSDRDIRQLCALQYRYMELITRARVERGEPTALKSVK